MLVRAHACRALDYARRYGMCKAAAICNSLWSGVRGDQRQRSACAAISVSAQRAQRSASALGVRGARRSACAALTSDRSALGVRDQRSVCTSTEFGRPHVLHGKVSRLSLEGPMSQMGRSGD